MNAFVRAADKHKLGQLEEIQEHVTLGDYYS